MNILSIPFPNLNPEIFSIGGISIKWYGIAYVASIIIGWKYVNLISQKNNFSVSKKNIDDLVIWLAIGIIIGGRIGYTLFYQPIFYINNPLKILEIWNGGMSFHGGLIGVIISLFIFSKLRRISLLLISDMLAIVTPIGLFFGRIANFINQELWGRITTVPWAFEFPLAGNLPRHPSQLYEALLEGLALYLLLAYLWHFTNLKNKYGLITGVFISGYSTIRFFVEFFREPDSYLGFIFYKFSMGQILSVPFAISGIILILFSLNKNKKQIE